MAKKLEGYHDLWVNTLTVGDEQNQIAVSPGTTEIGRLGRWNSTDGSSIGQTSAIYEAASGYVGIGVTNPAASLQVNASANNSTAIFRYDSGSAQISLRGNSASVQKIRFGTASNPVQGLIDYDNPTESLRFGSNAISNRLVIDASGNVGIGLTSPAVKLDVDGPVCVKSYTVATVPAAAAKAGQLIYVSNEVGGAVHAFSDGTNWRRMTDRAVIAA